MSYAVASSGGANTRTAGAGAVPSLDLDQRSERAGALREGRGADVKREHVRVAVTLGLVAAAAGSNHAPVAMTTTPGITSGSTTAPARHAPRDVEHAHDVAVVDVALRRVRRADADWLASGHLLRA